MEINNDELKTVLKLKGYEFPVLTDSEFDNIVKYYTDYITSELGINLGETERTDTNLYAELSSGYYLLQYFPVSSIESITINYLNSEKIITEDKYDVDKLDGIIKFHEYYDDDKIIVKYTTSLTKYVELKIQSLLFDMLIYCFIPENEKDVTSIHEGDVSINFNSANSLGSKINTEISNLKNILNSRVQMI